MKSDRLDLILGAVCEFEAQAEGAAVPPVRKFARQGPWLASDNVILRLAAALFLPVRPPIPGLFRKHMAGLVLSRIFKAGCAPNLASSAEGMQIKLDGTRLRAFFLPSASFPEGLCLKIVPTDKVIAKRTRHEMDIRKKLTELGTITVPAVRSIRETAQYIFVSEELIAGQRFRMRQHERLYCRQGMAELVATYKAFGVSRAPLGDHYSLALGKKIETEIRQLSGGDAFLCVLQAAASGSLNIPISMCHRDLLPSNLCVSNGKLYFLDWEMAAPGPVFTDLMQLPLRYPDRAGLFKAVVQLFAREFEIEGDEISHMFTALIAARIAKEPHKAKKFVDIWRRNQQVFS